MKHYILFLCAIFQTSAAFGQGSLYSFSGNVSSLFYDGGGILAAHSVAVGDPVSVSYIVNFGSPGYYQLNDGSVEVPTDAPLSNVHTEYFYSSLSSGTLLPIVNGGFTNQPRDIAGYFTSWNQNSPSGNEGLLQGGSGNSSFSVRRSDPQYINGVPYLIPDVRVQDWQVGTEVRGVIVAWSDLDWSIAWTDMRLDSITVVPEPRVIPLFSIGGITLALWGRRRANQSPEPLTWLGASVLRLSVLVRRFTVATWLSFFR